MNLFVCVDENLNILSLNHFKPYKKTMVKIKELLENKAVVFDNEFIDYISNVPSCSKIIYDENIKSNLPEFLLPVLKTKEKVFGNFKDLFDHLKRLEDKNIFIIGHKIFQDFLPFVNDIYQLNILEILPDKDKFMNIKENQNWKLMMNSEPIFENERTIYFTHYKRKRDKLEFSQLEEIEFEK